MTPDHAEEARRALHAAAPVPQAPVAAEEIVARGRRLARRRAAARGVLAAVVLALVPVAGASVGRWAAPVVDLAPAAPVTASADGREAPPSILADGRPPDAAAPAVAARFDLPVVAARRTAALPAEARERCAAPRVPGGEGSALGARLRRLADGADRALVHVGPDAFTLLAVGSAQSPPGYPDAYGVSCVVRPAVDGVRSDGAAVDHLFAGWTGHSRPAGAAEPHVWTTALPVPEGARWAVQERTGWWLAYDVGGTRWFLAQAAPPDGAGSAADPAFPGARVVFLDREGRVLEDVAHPAAVPVGAPFARSQATPATIHLGAEEDLRADLARGPVPVCAPERTVCVWLVDVGGRLLALSAASPLPVEVPPFGYVGWCPADGTFHESHAGSRFSLDGTRLAGPAPVGLHRYAVVVDRGRVRVDLSRFSFGPDEGAGADRDRAHARSSAERGGSPPCSRLLEPGFALP